MLIVIFTLVGLGFGIDILSWSPLLDVNAQEHNTKMYHIESPLHSNTPSALYGMSNMGNRMVLRRGRSFLLGLEFSRPLQKKDRVIFSLHLNGAPQETISWTAYLYADTNSDRGNTSFWANIEPPGANPDVYIFRLNYPLNAWIGEFDIRAIVRHEDYSKSTVDDFAIDRKRIVTAPFKLMFVFDPENPYEQVYKDSAEDRQEYCFNEFGRLWGGTADDQDPRPWLYSQFTPEAVEVAVHMLSNLTLGNRTDVMDILRWLRLQFHHLSPLLPPHRGLLIGKWEGSFADGTEPDAWTGSRDIFRQFIDNNYTPVKYGQCFIFAATSTSILRSLGIPARALTAFGAATVLPPFTKEASIDNFYRFNTTSNAWQFDHQKGFLWNFHAWTDVWILRQEWDGSKLYSWQAFDATNTIGPVSVTDVRNEHWDAKFDGNVFLSMLHAPINIYVDNDPRDNETTWELTSVRTDPVGSLLVTKGRGNTTESEDITLEYKKFELMHSRLGPEHGGSGVGACVDWNLKLSAERNKDDSDSSVHSIRVGEDVTIEADFELTEECLKALEKDGDADVIEFNVTVNFVLSDQSNRYSNLSSHDQPRYSTPIVATPAPTNPIAPEDENDENPEGSTDSHEASSRFSEATLLESPSAYTVSLSLANPKDHLTFTVAAGTYTSQLRPGMRHVRLDGTVTFFDPRHPERTELHLDDDDSTTPSSSSSSSPPTPTFAVAWKDVALKMPNLNMAVELGTEWNEHHAYGEIMPVDLTLMLTNPLPSSLHNVSLNLELGFVRADVASTAVDLSSLASTRPSKSEGTTVDRVSELAAGATYTWRVPRAVTTPGTYHVVAAVSSSQLSGIYATTTFTIPPRPSTESDTSMATGLIVVLVILGCLCLGMIERNFFVKLAYKLKGYHPIPDAEEESF